jgi:hypothetical protein
MLMTTEDICTLVANDEWMMRILHLTKSLNLPNWWIGAGFLRNKVWDTISELPERTPLGDIDVIFFDEQHVAESREKEFERVLTQKMPDTPWSVTNQARMHNDSGNSYASLNEALSEWPETATAIAVKLNDQNKILLNAPLGIDDLVNLRVCPTPCFMRQRKNYEERQLRKNWQAKWPKLTFFTFPD